jgi:ribokinase
MTNLDAAHEPRGGNYSKVRIVVLGALNTDISVVGVPHLPRDGEALFGSALRIGPGGKSRNVANMITCLTNAGVVAMLSHTCRDPFGLWKVPYEALQVAGVNMDFVTVVDCNSDQPYPAIALLTVDTHGSRASSLSNNILNGLTRESIENALPLLDAASENNGLLALSLEVSSDVAAYAMRCAAERSLRIVLDPGGLSEDVYSETLFQQKIFLLKPNEHEIKRMTGIEVSGFDTAARAAAALRDRNIENVLITHGKNGAYFIGEDIEECIMVPDLRITTQADATGCGDQVMATLCAYLCEGKELIEAVRLAIIAGTLQFNRVGIQPVARSELAAYTTY